jgi:hypothetical protein
VDPDPSSVLGNPLPPRSVSLSRLDVCLFLVHGSSLLPRDCRDTLGPDPAGRLSECVLYGVCLSPGTCVSVGMGYKWGPRENPLSSSFTPLISWTPEAQSALSSLQHSAGLVPLAQPS